MAPPGSTALDVYLRDELIGEANRPGSGRITFTYAPNVRDTHDGERLLSVSLPVRAERYPNRAAKPFFEGLLPEGTLRERIARDFHVGYDNGFELLARIGAECAGAVVVVPRGSGAPSAEVSVQWLSEDELHEKLLAAPLDPLGVHDRRVRLSLGGVQDKLVLTKTGSDQFGIPLDGTPSTHILKPNQERYADIVANEAFCLRVAACLRLPTARAEVMRFRDLDCLVIERFDRTLLSDTRVTRLHQEDFCQALGILPANKYEADGGPSLTTIIEALREFSDQPARSVTDFVNAVVFNFLIGNSDAHGKNFALLHGAPGSCSLAPFYDLVCTAVYDVTTDLAMSIGGEVRPDDVGQAAWREFARSADLNPTLLLGTTLRQLAERTVACATAVRGMAQAEGWFRPVIDDIVRVCEARATQLLALAG